VIHIIFRLVDLPISWPTPFGRPRGANDSWH